MDTLITHVVWAGISLLTWRCAAAGHGHNRYADLASSAGKARSSNGNLVCGMWLLAQVQSRAWSVTTSEALKRVEPTWSGADLHVRI